MTGQPLWPQPTQNSQIIIFAGPVTMVFLGFFLLCGHVLAMAFLREPGSALLASAPPRGYAVAMATKAHRERFPDTFLPYGEKPSGEEKKAAAKSEASAVKGGGSDLILVAKGLTMEQKRFVVESFACFQGVTDIAAELKRRWGLSLDLRHIAAYDARRPQCRMGKGLRLLYAETRQAYVNGTAEVAVAHQSHRLRLVGRIVEKATNSKDYAAALKGLELAAKEMGGALSGQHVVRHEGTIGHVHATVEEAKAEIASRLTQVIEGGLLLPSPEATEEGAG